MFAQTHGMQWNITLSQGSQAAMRMYNDAIARGLRGQLWASLTGRSQALLSLEEFIRASTIKVGSNGGRRRVAIAQIDGSENRAADFDRNFNPLQDRTRDRWLSIANAWRRGRYLPPVMLIQVGDHYFVRDGHHRISVARALGLDTVEASVEVWIVDEPQATSSQCYMPRIGGPYSGYW